MKIKQSIITLILAFALAMPAFAFADITDEDLAIDVATLESMGVVNGYTDGTYKPDNDVSRAEFCALIVRLTGLSSTSFGQAFSDVSMSHWAYSDIQALVDAEIIQGYGNGIFAPSSTINMQEAITVVLRALGYSDSAFENWPADNIAMAKSLGLLDDIDVEEKENMSRGDVATLLVAAIQLGNSNFFIDYDSRVTDVILMDVSDNILTYYNGSTFGTYMVEDDFPEELIQCGTGTLYIESGSVAGFLPDGDDVLTLNIASVDASGFTLTSGATYLIDSNVTILYDDETIAFGSGYYRLGATDNVTLYFDEYGDISYIMAGTSSYTDGYVITGIYEYASPNTSQPTTIKVAGATFDISSSVSISFSAFSLGDRVCIYLDENGDVTRVEAYSSSLAEDMVGILDGNSVILTCGITLSGTIDADDYAEGELVKVTQSSAGELSITHPVKTTKYDLDLTDLTLGSYDLSDAVQIYESVGQSAATQISLSDIPLDVVDSDQILYYHLNSDGDVDILLLDDMTGNCYTYGFIAIKSVTSSGLSSGSTITNYQWAIVNGDGTSAYASSNVVTSKDGEVAGLVINGEGKTESIVYLTAIEDLVPTDFTSSSYLGGFAIADEMQVYYDTIDEWVTLEYALANATTLDAYYDRGVDEGGQIRVIIAY